MPALNTGNGNGHSANGSSNGHGHAANGHGRNGARRSGSRRATVSQARAIHAIVNRQGSDLVGTLRERFGVERPEDLSVADASQFIDELKAAPNVTGACR